MSAGLFNHMRLDWRVANPRDVAVLVSHIRLRHPDCPPLEALGIRAERAELPFYAQHALFRITRRCADGTLANCFVLHSSADSKELTGASGPIHEVNAIEGLTLAPEACTAYLRFFFYFVRGEHGAFTLLDDPSIVKEGPGGPHERLRQAIVPLEPRQVDEDASAFSALVHYRDDVFACDVTVTPDGAVQMENDRPVMDGVGADSIHEPAGLWRLSDLVDGALEDAWRDADRDERPRIIDRYRAALEMMRWQILTMDPSMWHPAGASEASLIEGDDRWLERVAVQHIGVRTRRDSPDGAASGIQWQRFVWPVPTGDDGQPADAQRVQLVATIGGEDEVVFSRRTLPPPNLNAKALGTREAERPTETANGADDSGNPAGQAPSDEPAIVQRTFDGPTTASAEPSSDRGNTIESAEQYIDECFIDEMRKQGIDLDHAICDPALVSDDAGRWCRLRDSIQRRQIAEALKRLRVVNFSLSESDDDAIVLFRETPFYPNYRLYRIVDLRGLRSRSTSLVLHKNGTDACFLGRDSGPIHAFNKKLFGLEGEFRIAHDTVAAYLRFFGEFVQGDQGAFHIIETPGELRWLEDKGGDARGLRHAVTAGLKPVRIYRCPISTDSADAGSPIEEIYCRAFVGYGRNLFVAGFRLRSTIVEPGDEPIFMFADRLAVMEDLPIEPLSFNPEFEFPLRSAGDQSIHADRGSPE